MTLVIRREQLPLLRPERASALEDRLLERLAQEYAGDYSRLGEAGALALVRETIRSAASRRVDSEAALIELLRLYVEFGLGLELAPHRSWANDVLDHPKLPGALKVSLVRQRLSALTQGRRVVLHREEA
jgi:hypothetical protein